MPGCENGLSVWRKKLDSQRYYWLWIWVIFRLTVSRSKVSRAHSARADFWQSLVYFPSSTLHSRLIHHYTYLVPILALARACWKSICAHGLKNAIAFSNQLFHHIWSAWLDLYQNWYSDFWTRAEDFVLQIRPKHSSSRACVRSAQNLTCYIHATGITLIISKQNLIIKFSKRSQDLGSF